MAWGLGGPIGPIAQGRGTQLWVAAVSQHIARGGREQAPFSGFGLKCKLLE